MAQAKCNLEKDGYLIGVLFVQTTKKQVFPILLADFHRLGSAEARQMAMLAIGKQIRDEGKSIAEAAMLHLGWFVKAQGLDAANMRPSQHPLRQEAICFVGRNASNTRATSIVQPFTRDADDRPIWMELSLEQYNVATSSSARPIGLLDYLFELASETH